MCVELGVEGNAPLPNAPECLVIETAYVGGTVDLGAGLAPGQHVGGLQNRETVRPSFRVFLFVESVVLHHVGSSDAVALPVKGAFAEVLAQTFKKALH